jgi:hypothetical protein
MKTTVHRDLGRHPFEPVSVYGVRSLGREQLSEFSISQCRSMAFMWDAAKRMRERKETSKRYIVVARLCEHMAA